MILSHIPPVVSLHFDQAIFILLFSSFSSPLLASNKVIESFHCLHLFFLNVSSLVFFWAWHVLCFFLCYIIILAGYPASLETLSPGLSPPPSLVPLSPLSYSSLPSTLPPSDYPASLRITAFPRYFLNLEA